MQHETNLAVAKFGPGVGVAIYQKVTSALPDLIMWATAIYTVLHLYVFVRDKFFRKKGE